MINKIFLLFFLIVLITPVLSQDKEVEEQSILIEDNDSDDEYEEEEDEYEEDENDFEDDIEEIKEQERKRKEAIKKKKEEKERKEAEKKKRQEEFERRLVPQIIENSGVLLQKVELDKIVKQNQIKIRTLSDTYKDFPLEKYVTEILNKSFTLKDKKELAKTLQNPFVSKIIKVFFAPIKDNTRFTLFLKRAGKKADKDKVALIQEIESLVKIDATQHQFQVNLLKAVNIKENRRIRKYKKLPLNKLELMASEYVSSKLKNILYYEQKIKLQRLYFKFRNIRTIELSEFKRVYAKNRLLIKFFNALNSAHAEFLKEVYKNTLKEIERKQ